jgi:hypothetical protein
MRAFVLGSLLALFVLAQWPSSAATVLQATLVTAALPNSAGGEDGEAFKVAVLVGTLRKGSFARMVAKAMIRLAPPSRSCETPLPWRAQPWSAATNVKGSFGDLTAGRRPRMHFLGEVL